MHQGEFSKHMLCQLYVLAQLTSFAAEAACSSAMCANPKPRLASERKTIGGMLLKADQKLYFK